MNADLIRRLRKHGSDHALDAADALEVAEAEVARLREALGRIANGDGYYGAQAREYKEIARAALPAKSAEEVCGEMDKWASDVEARYIARAALHPARRDDAEQKTPLDHSGGA